MSSKSITADNKKKNGSDIFGIAISVKKVDENSRGSENLLLKEKNGICLWLRRSAVQCKGDDVRS